ncbi:sickle tail protein homolog isoform X4 [Latimeria chalumnae]|uniref:sickle tail protein homolog isoform X4 n=1 Tax=Latimeria chalumnae TaxID=7897 RepID=UPI00313D3AB1
MEENTSQESKQGLTCSDNRHVIGQGKTNLRVTSVEDAEHVKPKERLANGSNHTSNTKPARNIPRRHTVGGPRSSKEILGMQTSEMDRKREAFLEHLKQKYPHHATAIMGHQERLRDQTLQCMLDSLQSELDIQRYLVKIESSQRARSPKPSQNLQSGVGDQTEHLSGASAESLEAMSEGEAPVAFTRGSRSRASLPVVRSSNQTKDKSLGILYLQYGDETKQTKMPNEITSADTIRALFVSAFPQQLTMKILDSPSVAIYVKEEMRNVYHELTDVRNIQDRSFLKVYHKDPVHAFNQNARAINGDIRMQREVVYTSRDGSHTLRHGTGPPPPHAIPVSPSLTPVAHSMPPSPSRIPYGVGRPMLMPGNATVPRDRLSSVPGSRSISPSPSAILERRDVKPDEDLSNKNLTLLRNESLYSDPYMFHEGRMSVASSHSGHPVDIPEHLIHFHRGALRSASTYSNATLQAEMMEQPLYRQKPRKYSESHVPWGSKTPPSSPHRITEMRVSDIHAQNPQVPPHAIQPERSSPVRHSFKKEAATSVGMETTTKPRNAVGTPVTPVMADIPPLSADNQALGVGSATTPNDPETRERMKAMEKQIASLTGLVQSALLKGPKTSNVKDVSSEKTIKTVSSVSSTDGGGDSQVPSVSSSLTTVQSTTIISQPPAISSIPVQVNVLDLRQNVSDLRLQLEQMRQLQLQYQETLKAMLKKAELEINGRVVEAMKKLEDPVQRQRVLVEEDRQKYLLEEEKIVKQLCDIESVVEDLRKDSASSERPVTLKDVEEGAFLLRQVGESLAILKGEFPALQNKMRAVLRVEVEAVKFLKEEPHKLDSLLKRVRGLTDILSTLRRYVTEGLLKSTESPLVLQHTVIETAVSTTESEVPKTQNVQVHEPVIHVQAQPQPSSPIAIPEPQSSSVKSEVMQSPTMVIHHVQSSPVVIHQSQHSSALFHHTQPSPSVSSQPQDLSMRVQNIQNIPASIQQTQDSAVSVQQVQNSSIQTVHPSQLSINGSTPKSLFIEEIHTASNRSRAMSIEAAEKEWEEKRQNLGHYDGKEFEKLLEEAQANMMKGIPSLEVAPELTPLPKSDVVDNPEYLEEVTITEQGPVKSPPPPPPRRSYPPGSGLTTGRSGEVIFTTKKETTVKENEEVTIQAPQSKIPRAPSEVKSSPITPPPISASAVKEDEDEGDKIMAELQAFQKCSLKDVSSKMHVEQPRVESQVKEIRPGALISPKEKKNLEFFCEDAQTAADETQKVVPELTRVVYCVTTGPQNEYIPWMAETTQKHFDLQSETIVNSLEPETTETEGSPTIQEFSKFQENLIMKNEESLLNETFKIQDTYSFEEKKEHISEEKEGIFLEVCEPAAETIEKDTKYLVSRENCESGFEEVINQDRSHTKEDASVAQQKTAVTNQEDLLALEYLQQQESPVDGGEKIVLRSKAHKQVYVKYLEDNDSTPSSPSEEIPSTDNIAFMITKTEVQVLSSGEVHEIVSRKGQEVQTVNIDAKEEMTMQQTSQEKSENEEPEIVLDKKPVIIIFDEPMDIRSAYKRLSTIFEECDEELEKMMSEEIIDEENEETEITSVQEEVPQVDKTCYTHSSFKSSSLAPIKYHTHGHSCLTNSHSVNKCQEKEAAEEYAAEDYDEVNIDSKVESQFSNKQDAKKKFKFKFPKKQLAALTQAIRTGTKTGKKTLQVVVYEDEEELDGTVKQHKEAKRFEIMQSKSKEDASNKNTELKQHTNEDIPASRTDEIRKNTYKTLDSLEQTIKQLETTISEMSPMVPPESMHNAEDTTIYSSHAALEATASNVLVQEEPKSPSDVSTSFHSTARKVSHKKSKPHPLPKPATFTSEQQGQSVVSTSRMPVPTASKSRQSQGSADRAGKQQKLQDPQRQFRQANGSTKKAGGDCKATSPTLLASKIPAFSPSPGKSSSVPAYSNESANPLNPPNKSLLPSPNLLNPQAGRNAQPSSHIPSVSNGSLKLQHSTHKGKGHHLSFPLQTQNGRPAPSSSSSSPSPVSPTSLSQGTKSIRTIHTPSFTSYKSQNGNTSKLTTSTAKETS